MPRNIDAIRTELAELEVHGEVLADELHRAESYVRVTREELNNLKCTSGTLAYLRQELRLAEKRQSKVSKRK